YERSMLHHLQARPGDYAGAIAVLPPKLRSLFISAYQSSLFNHALSTRIGEGIPLDTPVPGDMLLYPDGKMDTVEPASMRAAAMQVSRGRAVIAILMPGGGAIRQPVSAAVQDQLTRDGISPESFRKAAAWAGVAFHGAPRPIAISPQIRYTIEGNDVFLEFALGPGQYATTICREFMKADPVLMA
ncbi:MAG: tRNA pseudouridine(13) synthase TruD, partial [Methanomicrobiales archaeon]|nr:tRNA pseudouridine(13) synthase TruD [Methanomicrobiales archaeon]